MPQSSSAAARDRMLAFETLLDSSADALEKRVEMTALRKLCARSIPDSPSQLRPLAYSLLLGSLPNDKKAWKHTARSQRERYYTLVGTFVDELENAPAPQDPPSPTDALLVRISKDVDRLDLAVLRARTLPSRSSPLAPERQTDGSVSDVSDASSTGAEDNQENAENAVRTTPSKRRSRPRTLRIGARRALFERLDSICDAQRRGPGSRSKGKQKEAVPGSSSLLSPQSPDAPNGQKTPSLSLTIPQDNASSQPPSPITLLSPQDVTSPPLPPPVVSPLTHSFAAEAPYLADTHAEALTRLLYVFCRTNPQWTYGPTFVNIVAPLYLVYCQANVPRGQRRSKYAEEETYWAFTALMGELGDVVAGNPGDDVMSSCLRRISARVRWADEPLWNLLKERNLDPGLPLYTFQWLSGLMSHDRPNLLPVWDFLFAQPPPTPDMNPKLDLLLDMCVALVVMVKRQVMFPPPKTVPPSPKRDMWHGSDIIDVGDPEDPDAAFVRCLQLFRDYPLGDVGGVWMLLNTAFELNQARRASVIEGVNPDLVAWTESMDAAANRTSWASSKIRAASASTGKLWSSYAESDAAARVAKASSNLTASAVAKWQAAPAAPDWKGLGAAAGRLFSRKPARDDDTGSVSGEEYEHLSGATTPLSNFGPSPEKRVPYTLGGRARSDSVASSALSVSSLQDRLSGLASTLSPNPQQPRPASGPRPLLLSKSVRRASRGRAPSGGHTPRSPSGSHNGSPSGLTGGLANPPHHEGHPGLYRIGSRNRTPPTRPVAGTDSISSITSVMKNNRQSLSSDQSTPYDSDYSYGSHAHAHSALALSSLPESRNPRLQSMVEPPEAPEPISIPTPQISHLTADDYEHVYEPAEDSFILLDALEADALVLRDAKPALCVEIGSGSGIASTFMGTLLGGNEALLISTDINKHAALATLRTGEANDVALNPVLANLLDPLEKRIAGQVDLLIFNPPYVVTDDDELVATQNGRDIGGAWAGGNLGMAVTNILLEKIPTLLAPGGRFYLVAIHQNKPDEIIARMRVTGLECKTVIKRRAGRELLSVIRMIRPSRPAYSALTPRGGLSIATPRSPRAAPTTIAQAPVPAVDSAASTPTPKTLTPPPAPPGAAVTLAGEQPNGKGNLEPSPASDRRAGSEMGSETEDYDVLLDAYSFMN